MFFNKNPILLTKWRNFDCNHLARMVYRIYLFRSNKIFINLKNKTV